MKKPSLNGWLAIIAALAALVLASVAAFSDGIFTSAEATDLTDKTGLLIEAVQQATTDDGAATPEAPEASEAQP